MTRKPHDTVRLYDSASGYSLRQHALMEAARVLYERSGQLTVETVSDLADYSQASVRTDFASLDVLLAAAYLRDVNDLERAFRMVEIYAPDEAPRAFWFGLSHPSRRRMVKAVISLGERVAPPGNHPLLLRLWVVMQDAIQRGCFGSVNLLRINAADIARTHTIQALHHLDACGPLTGERREQAVGHVLELFRLALAPPEA
ncbi:hypothetical protein JNJ66_04330 [Candidatus Saccharibacteria bacterium]|nr:hypothetical protein [Candidatus Saccharibacteria bacterium]